VTDGPTTELDNKSIFEIDISGQKTKTPSEKIKILSTRIKGVPLDVGQPLDFQGRIGTVSVAICLDTGGGASVVNPKLTNNESFTTLATTKLEHPIHLEVRLIKLFGILSPYCLRIVQVFLSFKIILRFYLCDP
jgi:hypothetical protein